MNFDLLRTFIAVVKHNSVTKASEEVFLTQPAVTKQLKILEKEYETKLFEREKNKLFLTNEGKILLDYAHRILGLYDESVAAVNEEQGQVKGTLKIAANFTLGIYVLPRLMEPFGNIYPDLKFEMFINNTAHVIEAMKRRDMSFGFIGVTLNEPSISIYPFYEDRLHVVISPRFGIRKRTISWKEVEKIPFIGREIGSDIRATYEEWLRERTVNLTQRMELNNTEAIKWCVQCGLGFSILPWCTIEQEVRLGLLETLSVPHFNPIQQFYIAHYKGKKLSKPERVFLEYIFGFIEKGMEL